ncbi:LOW QUALITY PROTEIN: E3 ubiquitin-protein ligase ZSWIM2 [Morus bassanus]
MVQGLIWGLERNDRCIDQKEIDDEDVCPPCQEELLKKMFPITYWRYSCANNVHVKCLKIWADHQDELQNDSVVKCPLPQRLILEEFGNSKQLVTATEKTRLDRHLVTPCNCRVFPLVGKCYKCTECVEYHLCHECFAGFCHSHVFRQKSRLSYTPKNTIKSLPIILISKHSNLLTPVSQYRLCVKNFQLGQHGRHLPCNHKLTFLPFNFLRECTDSWLLQQSSTCPIDEYVVYNPLTWKDMSAKHRNYPTGSHANVSKLAKQVEPEIYVSGNGLFLKQISSEHASESSQSNLKKTFQ